jgi:hypothetical protein
MQRTKVTRRMKSYVSLGHLVTLVSSGPYRVTRLEPSPATLTTLMHSILLTGLHPRFKKNGINYSNVVVTQPKGFPHL